MSLFIIFYAYFGYSIILLIIEVIQRLCITKGDTQGKLFIRSRRADHELPTVSFIISAYNEEKPISQKIENSLNQIYPCKKLEIVIASGCSTDRTGNIVQEYVRQRG